MICLLAINRTSVKNRCRLNRLLRAGRGHSGYRVFRPHAEEQAGLSSPLLFIVRAVIPMKFIDMVVVVPNMGASVVAHVYVFSSSLTLMKPENPALRSRSLKWHITVRVSAIPPEH